MASHQHLVESVQRNAAPFEQQVNERVSDISTRWQDLDKSLLHLSSRYGNAVDDWVRIESTLGDILRWAVSKIDWSQQGVKAGQEAEALAEIEVNRFITVQQIIG